MELSIDQKRRVDLLLKTQLFPIAITGQTDVRKKVLSLVRNYLPCSLSVYMYRGPKMYT